MKKTVNFIPPEKIKCFDLGDTYADLKNNAAWNYESDSHDFYFRVVLEGSTIHVHSYEKDSRFYILSYRFRLNSMKTFHKRMEVFFAKMNTQRLNA